MDGEHAAIGRLRNELANAQFDLDQTTVRAPTGGFVTELALRPGVYVVPAPFRLAILDIVDDMSNYHVPLGSSGEAAIYTDHFHELSLLRKILLWKRSWQNYFFLESL